MQALVEQFKKFIDEGILDPDAVSCEVQDTISFLNRKKVAMMYTASYHFDRFQEMPFSEDIVCINFPSFKDKPEYKDIWIAKCQRGLYDFPHSRVKRNLIAACKLLALCFRQRHLRAMPRLMAAGFSGRFWILIYLKLKMLLEVSWKRFPDVRIPRMNLPHI